MDNVETQDPETESNLVQHAREELRRAGLFDEDADYGGEVGHNVLKLVRVFSTQDHSGGSAELTIYLLHKLLRYKALTPITSDPAEWMDVTDGLWQNRRSSTLFSNNGGKTWWDIDNLPLRMRIRNFLWRLFH
jgi:hypothetical protein